MTGGLHAARYYGGKSGYKKPVARWIAQSLPEGRVYCEPYAGMLGVLLQRQPAPHEIANDLDMRIYTWWRVVRDRPAELERWLSCTPYSRAQYDDTLQVVADDTAFAAMLEADEVAAAGHVTVSLQQSYRPVAAGNGASGWRPLGRQAAAREKGGVAGSWLSLRSRIRLLSERISAVNLECKDACWLVDRWCDDPAAVLYLDPPYEQGGSAYSANTGQQPMLDLLCSRQPQAKVAVSGYASCAWSVLEDRGWHRQQKEVGQTLGEGLRTEVLWTNYAPVVQQELW